MQTTYELYRLCGTTKQEPVLVSTYLSQYVATRNLEKEVISAWVVKIERNTILRKNPGGEVRRVD